MRKGWKNYLYVLTTVFFAMGFINIAFAWLGFVCMITPFVLLARDKRKTWCQGYCPRASLFGVLLRSRSLTGKPAPAWLSKGKGKWFMLGYFIFNLFVIIISTIMVSSGIRPPSDRVGFANAIQLPWEIPQLLNLGPLPDWASHLSFMMYSMMFTTTVLGLIFGWLFKPRTWCTVCPVNTMSDLLLRNKKECSF
ncbi:MAG: hypothetical protein N2489_03320 [Clostridia bacterium]|nr:hypothetical protein [Clostridia bacterium]